MSKKLYYLLFLPFLISTCSEDETKKTKHLFTKYLVDEISIKEYPYDETGGSFELGWVFNSETGGKVVELGGLFPESGVYTVTLWDENGNDLAMTEVTATAGKLVMKKITPSVTIETGVDYVVSYNTYDSRDYYWLDPDVSIYPLELDGITVLGEVEVNNPSSTSLFPGLDLHETIVGVPEIGFIKN